MPPPLKSKDDVLAILLEIFRREGYDGASLAELSKATGLGKSSLYHYFPGGKEDMVSQVLDLVDAWMLEQVVEPLGGIGTPAARLDHMLDAVSTFYAEGAKACILGRLCASVDRERFQKRVEALFSAWIEALAAVIAETGVSRAASRQRAEDAVVRIQGVLVVCEGLRDPAPFRRTIRQLRAELLGPR
jgi:TetR/AcrR family transcriptional regulator, lmrAB and yxaGH operons repressor